jgi:Zn-dependent protease with chaperone function
MQFFEQQDQARAQSGRLLLVFALAVLGLGLVSAVSAHLLLNFNRDPEAAPFVYHDQVVWCAALGTWGIIFLGSAYKMTTLRAGGHKVAESMGGTLLMANSSDPLERRVLNVVEEMAIAAGLPVPPVYLLRGETGINAFAAGWSHDDAVIGVTHGALTTLSRDQLQGVIAHEFSHILHRDCALNMRLLGVLYGIVVISSVGRLIMHMTSGSRHRSTKKEGGIAQLFVVGAVLWLFGSLGVLVARLIQAAVSQQREYLADASAVQFTRNPLGIAGALAQIASASSALASPSAKDSSHMLISSPSSSSFAGLLSSHPPLFERISRLVVGWDGSFDSLVGTSGSKAEDKLNRASVKDGPMEIDLPHLVAARGLLESMQITLSDAAHDPYQVRALLIAFLFDPDPIARTAQTSTLSDDPALLREVYAMEEPLVSLELRQRKALFNLGLPTLAALSAPQCHSFAQVVRALRDQLSDDNLSGYCFALLILRHLGLAETEETPPVLVKTAIEIALGMLAAHGNTTRAQAETAFTQGAQRFSARGGQLRLPADEQLSVRSLHAALNALRRLPVKTRQDLLNAAEVVATEDGVVKDSEKELLSILASSLDVACPLVA